MCNGHSTRISQGGSIAVLRPRSREPSPTLDPPSEWRLFFSNDAEAAKPNLGTHVELQGSQDIPNSDYKIFIHHDGDLSASTSILPPNHIPANPFFAFSLMNDNTESVVQLPHRLDLGVGGEGIIGRRVSLLVTNRAGDGDGLLTTVAEGIIGWN